MTRSEIRMFMDGLFDAVNAHDNEALRRSIAPECRFVDPASREPYDLDGFVALHGEYYDHFPDVRWNVEHRLIEAGGACYVYRCSGTGVGEWPSGNPIEGKVHDMIEAMTTVVTSRGIVDLRFHIDVDALSRQPWHA